MVTQVRVAAGYHEPLCIEKNAALLTSIQVQKIDEALFSEASDRWQKIAKIVGMTMLHLPSRVHGIPGLYYGQRVRELVAKGLLESKGNLQFMRYYEVRRIRYKTGI